MRAVVQRVERARVTVDGETVGSIGSGLAVLLGVAAGDDGSDARAIADKIAGLRIFGDEEGKMNLSVGEIDGEVLVVSQFTLLADIRKGRRPSFTDAAPPDRAADLVAAVVARLSSAGLRCASGRFGARMSVDLVNHGPVTIIVETSGGRVV